MIHPYYHTATGTVKENNTLNLHKSEMDSKNYFGTINFTSFCESPKMFNKN